MRSMKQEAAPQGSGSEDTGIMHKDGMVLMKRYGGNESVGSHSFSENHDGSEHLDQQHAREDEDEIGLILAKRETRAVARLRLLLVFSLVAATVMVSVCVYLYSVNHEKEEFENAFRDASQKLGEVFQRVLERKLGVVASFSVAVTSAALAANATWPFFTMPQMEAHARNMLALAGARRMVLSPIVRSNERQQWGDYLVENIEDWAEESFAYNEKRTKPLIQDVSTRGNITDVPPSTAVPTTATSPPFTPQYEGQPDFSRGYSVDIYSYGVSSSGQVAPLVREDDGPFIAWWQYAPMLRNEGISPLTNYDMVKDTTFDGEVLEVIEDRKAAIGRMSFENYANGRDDESDKRPISGFYYPVLGDLEPDAPAVAAVATLIPWESYFVNVLPENLGGIVAVLGNTCNQSVTFQIDGRRASYLGEGDLHDPRFDNDWQEEFSLLTLVNSKEKIDSAVTTEYLGFPLYDQGCQYTLRVYASVAMESEFISNRPVVYMIGSMLIFLFTSLAFLCYDRLVEYRQRLVMKQAQASGAIVSSLFPAAYRDRLMQQAGKNKKTTAESKDTFIQSSIKRSKQDDNGTVDDEPIADLYSDCTIIFADIVGFTAWSSTRDPIQVFTLLQNVFGAFDKLAKQRKVFKVETIGDSYMAATGLPDAQPDHAVIMAKFANDILVAMKQTTCQLSGCLGDGTDDLSLRIGLHSGQVTAGILRGEKSRFQLFGDTVNTASRMESKGIPNRIQVSQSTAYALALAGKSHWLQAREDRIDAKGKGLLKTFWLTIPADTKSVTQSVTQSVSRASDTPSTEMTL